MWKASHWSPSETFGVLWRDLAVDLDNAVALFGQHVESEIEKAIATRRDKALKGGKKKRSRTPSREELESIADRVWNRLVRRLLVWRFAATDGTSNTPEVGGYYTIEKEITGTAADLSPWLGARRVIWDDGRVEEYDAEGRLLT